MVQQEETIKKTETKTKVVTTTKFVLIIERATFGQRGGVGKIRGKLCIRFAFCFVNLTKMSTTIIY